MKRLAINRHKPLLTALKKTGLRVDNLEQQGKKTVITVTAAVQKGKSRCQGNVH